MKLLKVLSVLLLAGLVVSLSGVSQAWAQEKAPEKAVTPSEKSAAPQEKSTNPMVMFKTTLGNFKIELFEKEAPITVKNFLGYVDKKYFDGTIFHRVIPGFVIQGGGFDKDMMQKAHEAPIQNEAKNGLKNLKGTLSMARTPDIGSATSQFFVNLVDNPPLDHTGDTPAAYGYAVFGKVVEGWPVIEKIAAVKTATRGQFENVPVEPIVVISATRVGGPKAAEAPKAAGAPKAPKTAPATKAPETPKSK
jgi:peptidyl-prolyl cis-trans isomerase A (cyclophilin A)